MVEGQYVPIKPTEKWIKKDKQGKPVYMQGALSYHQIQKKKAISRSEMVNELARQRSTLSQEVRDFFDDNFKFKGFSLDYHAFFNPKYGSSTMRGLVEAKRNMKALAEMEYDDAFFESLQKRIVQLHHLKRAGAADLQHGRAARGTASRRSSRGVG